VVVQVAKQGSLVEEAAAGSRKRAAVGQVVAHLVWVRSQGQKEPDRQQAIQRPGGLMQQLYLWEKKGVTVEKEPAPG
jgi:hypothetical protein